VFRLISKPTEAPQKGYRTYTPKFENGEKHVVVRVVEISVVAESADIVEDPLL
jgi:hypothetical protein